MRSRHFVDFVNLSMEAYRVQTIGGGKGAGTKISKISTWRQLHKKDCSKNHLLMR
jgi:hypothetical protein